MDQSLQCLLDREAVRDAVTELFLATDLRDWRRVEACFADEVLFDVPPVTGDQPTNWTPSQIVKMLQEAVRELQFLHHQIGNFTVQVDGDDADASCYCTASQYRENPTGNNTRTFICSFDFRLSKQDGSWRVNRYKLNLKYVDGNLELTG